MKKVFLIHLIAAIALSLASCSSNESNIRVDEVAIAEPTVEAVVPPSLPIEVVDAASALAEGNRLLEANETEKAIETFSKALEFDPDLGDAHFKLGIAHSLIEKEAEVNALSEVTPTPDTKEKKPKSPKDIKPESEKNFENAVKAYKKHLAKHPKDDIAQYNLGRAYNKLNEDEDAAKALREAVRLKPEDTEYQTELGSIYIKLAKYPEAVSALRKAVQLDSSNSQAEDLLDKAEAGRRRTDFTPVKKDAKTDKASRPASEKREGPKNEDARPEKSEKPEPPKKDETSKNNPKH
ncbi:MAG: tetratricopeptide repeat protein [Pyrinomonadaceae bacterium]